MRSTLKVTEFNLTRSQGKLPIEGINLVLETLQKKGWF